MFDVNSTMVFNRFDRWSTSGRWTRLFEALRTDPGPCPAIGCLPSAVAYFAHVHVYVYVYVYGPEFEDAP
jgi:hypothetical protein